MKSMVGGTYWDNVRKSFLPEFISMNFMMAGMAPVMSFLMMGRDMRAMVPTELLFWGVMSLGVNVASLPQSKMMRAIDAIGARVAPALHQADAVK